MVRSKGNLDIIFFPVSVSKLVSRLFGEQLRVTGNMLFIVYIVVRQDVGLRG